MERLVRLVLVSIFLIRVYSAASQLPEATADPDRAKKFEPYLIARHGGAHPFDEFKSANKYQYLKELWYYSESFYVRRNYFETGLTLDESTIDISRFEGRRHDSEETIITFTDFRDVIVMLPANKLIYKPEEK